MKLQVVRMAGSLGEKKKKSFQLHPPAIRNLKHESHLSQNTQRSLCGYLSECVCMRLCCIFLTGEAPSVSDVFPICPRRARTWCHLYLHCQTQRIGCSEGQKIFDLIRVCASLSPKRSHVSYSPSSLPPN